MKHPATILRFVAAFMLLGAMADNPYAYYQMLRWVVCGVGAYCAYLAYEEKRNTWAWIFGVTAVLFNPIAPIYLERETWVFIDLGVAAMFFVSLFSFKAVTTHRQ